METQFVIPIDYSITLIYFDVHYLWSKQFGGKFHTSLPELKKSVPMLVVYQCKAIYKK